MEAVRLYFTEGGRDCLTGRVERVLQELKIQKAAGTVEKKPIIPPAPKPLKFVQVRQPATPSRTVAPRRKAPVAKPAPVVAPVPVVAPPPVVVAPAYQPPPVVPRAAARQYPRPMFQQERELSASSMESYEDDGGEYVEGQRSPNQFHDSHSRSTGTQRHAPALYDAPRRPIVPQTPPRQLLVSSQQFFSLGRSPSRSPTDRTDSFASLPLQQDSSPEPSPPGITFQHEDSPEPIPLGVYSTPEFSFQQPLVSPQEAQRSFSGSSSSNSIISYTSQSADDFGYLSKKKYSQPAAQPEDPRNVILNSIDSSAVAASWNFVDPEADAVAMGYNSSPSASYQSSPSPSYVDMSDSQEQPSQFAQQWINQSSQESPTRAAPAGPVPAFVRSHSLPPPERFAQFDNVRTSFPFLLLRFSELIRFSTQTGRYYSPPLESTPSQYQPPPYVVAESAPQFDLAPAPMFHPTYTQHVSSTHQEAYLYEQKQQTLKAAEEAHYRLEQYQAAEESRYQQSLPPSPPRMPLPHQAPSRYEYPNHQYLAPQSQQALSQHPVQQFPSTHPITNQQFFTPLPSMKAYTDYSPPSVGSSLLNPPSNSHPAQNLSPNSSAQEFGLGLTSIGPLGGRSGLGGGLGPRKVVQSSGNDFYMTMADHPFGNGLRISQPEARIGSGNAFAGAEGDWY